MIFFFFWGPEAPLYIYKPKFLIGKREASPPSCHMKIAFRLYADQPHLRGPPHLSLSYFLSLPGERIAMS